MVKQSFKLKKFLKPVSRKLKSGKIVHVISKIKKKKVPVKLSYVKKPGPGNCLRGTIMSGKFKGESMSFSRKNVLK